MPRTHGFLHRLKWLGSNTVVAYLGPTRESVRLFALVFPSDDRAATLARTMTRLLTAALVGRHPVTVTHAAGADEIRSVELAPYCEIQVVDEAIHGDFFSVTGVGVPTQGPPEPEFRWPPATRIPPCELVFEVAGATERVPVTFSRPHLALIQDLPGSVPLGTGTVRLESRSVASAPVAVNVSAGPPRVKRVIQPGAAKPDPYGFAFVSTPAIEPEAGGGAYADTLMSPELWYGYRRALIRCLTGILGDAEDVFTAGDRDSEWRIVSIRDPARGATRGNALVREEGVRMIPQADRTASFVADYGESPDVAFVIHGSARHSLDFAIATLDDDAPGRPGVPFTRDGITLQHWRYPARPGVAAIRAPLERDVIGLREPVRVLASWLHALVWTALHELLHAVSEARYGYITDLYRDEVYPFGGRVVNQRFRRTPARADEPPPQPFGVYNGATYWSAPNRKEATPWVPADRDPKLYEEGGVIWSSFHPERINPFRKNVMDAPAEPGARLDRLTYAFVLDRMGAKLDR